MFETDEPMAFTFLLGPEIKVCVWLRVWEMETGTEADTQISDFVSFFALSDDI